MKWLGIGVAILIGVIAAAIFASNLARESHTTLVRVRVCSNNSDTRASGWSLFDESWSSTEQAALERALIDSSDEARQDAILNGFIPTINLASFAKAIVAVAPHRAVEWLEESDGSPQWNPTVEALLNDGDPTVRRGTLQAIVRQFSPATFPVFRDAAHNREKVVLTFLVNGLNGVDVSPKDNTAKLRSIIDDTLVPIQTRRRAAWHVDDLDDSTTKILLKGNTADETGSVYLAALLAEKHLSNIAQQDLIKRWLTDPATHRRRMVAVLVALRDDNPTALSHAETTEEDPATRRTMRLALIALNHWNLEGVSPKDYQARTRLLANGSPDPDALLLGLLGGNPAGFSILTQRLTDLDQPPWRVVLLGRMIPSWHTILTQPPALDLNTLNNRFDCLEAHRLSLETTLKWNAESRKWVAILTTSQDDEHHE